MRVLLVGDALGVGLGEHRDLPAFGEVQRVDEAKAVKSLPAAGQLRVGVFDVESGDVVGQQHHLVGPELALVHARQVGLRDAVHQVHDEIARARAGIEDDDIGVAQLLAELGAENLGHAGAHEIHDGLRCVDDAVGVGGLPGIALEEALVDGVQEVLLLLEIGNRAGSPLDGDVERVEAFKVLGAAEALAHQRIDNALDFGGDGVAASELGKVEDGPDEALGEKVLDQHVIHGLAADVGVE